MTTINRRPTDAQRALRYARSAHAHAARAIRHADDVTHALRFDRTSEGYRLQTDARDARDVARYYADRATRAALDTDPAAGKVATSAAYAARQRTTRVANRARVVGSLATA